LKKYLFRHIIKIGSGHIKIAGQLPECILIFNVVPRSDREKTKKDGDSMFEQSFVSGTARTRKAGTMVVSITIQGLLVVAGLVIPLMNPELLPSKAWVTQVMSPPPPPPPPPPAPAIVRASRKVVPKQFNSGVLTAPQLFRSK
jgi:hypothetical protein